MPTSPYGLSKATALHYLDWYRQHRNLPYVALALGNVYGPRQFGLDCGVVSRMANDIVRGSMPSITGDGQQTRDFVYVAEAVPMSCAAGATTRAAWPSRPVSPSGRHWSTTANSATTSCSMPRPWSTISE